MGKNLNRIMLFFVAVMLLFCLFLTWYIPTRSQLDFQLSDLELSLETSRGRERKQQYEYDQVVAELPVTKAELAEAQPLADAAKAEVKALREERNALREKKQALLEAAEAGGAAKEADESGARGAEAEGSGSP